jgi:hypothetical protein
MAEFLVRFVFEIILLGLLEFIGSIGRLIARAAVPLFGGGRVLIEPVPGNLVIVRRWHGMHHLTDGTPVMGKRLAAIVGLLVLAAALILVAVMLVLLRA